jgi:DNA-binding transcriptional ArsR family regulator
MMDIYVASMVYSALSDPTRLRVLQRVDGKLAITELAQAVEVSPSTAGYHVERLREAGLLHVRRDGRRHVPVRVGHGWGVLGHVLG